MRAQAPWWQTGAIYQIYPRSFQDSNADGVGDLDGIRMRLPHLADLGVDAIWISPIFPSPMRDFGYDVSDYCNIDPLFGTLADFDALVFATHALGMKLIVDFVPNHTSDLHPWFRDSRSSRLSAYRDWYIWRDAKPDGSAPNNWESEFGGPSWTLDPATGQYYYHAFLKEQPDLNWRNPAVREAMHAVLRFWLDRGVDGFRVDAIHHLFEDEGLTDNPPNLAWSPGKPPKSRWLQIHSTDQVETHAAIAEMRAVVDRYPGRVMIGEAYLPIDRLMAYYGVDLGGFHMPFNFHLISTRWEPRALAALIEAYEAALPVGGWPNWVLGNHDRSRVASRVGLAQARVAAMLLLTLRGTPTIYQGEEIGMTDVPIAPELVQDPWEKNVPGLGLGRDPVRTPVPWSKDRHSGFTAGEPWLPIGRENAPDVLAQSRDSKSMLSLYRALLRMRRSDVLTVGAFGARTATEHGLAYERRLGGETVVVALNLSGETQEVALGRATRTVLLSTYMDDDAEVFADRVRLRPNEGLVLRETD